MTGSTSESPVRDLLATMTAESVAASSLDHNTLMLVRIPLCQPGLRHPPLDNQ
jgi:hypothetical protein